MALNSANVDGATRKVVRAYGVRQVRGPFLKLPPHVDHCRTTAELKDYCEMRRADGALLAADLFCGAGGLSLGIQDAGIETVFGVDHYDEAIQTHAHHFPGMSVNWDLSTAESVERVAELMNECGIDVLAGGPPCQPFSKAGRSMIRHLVMEGARDPLDVRRDLWRSYLEVVMLAQPRAVIMENVPDMALDSEMFILRSMVEELEQIGYSVKAKVMEAWRYGVPQFRQRLILVALRDGLAFEWPQESTKKVTLWNAIGDMPEVDGGWRPKDGAAGWLEYGEPVTSFQKYIRRRVRPEDKHKLYDHITRPVRDDDRRAFELMSSKTKYSDLPEEFQRYRTDIFNDKYKRLDEDDLSRTITAHIAKDGYWYIHPRQSRTLTVREAARVQTFPDDFRFNGPPSAAFKQIGNAVPVRLGQAVGSAVVAALEAKEEQRVTSHSTARRLARWYRKRDDSINVAPWLASRDRWKVVAGEILLDRATPAVVRAIWPVIDELPGPSTEAPEARDTVGILCEMSRGVGREARAETLEALARQIGSYPEALWEPVIDRGKLKAIAPAVGQIAELAAPVETKGDERNEEPVLVVKGVLRVTSRYLGLDVERRNRRTDGRITVGRMLGMNKDSRDAHLGLIELAQSVCKPENPVCSQCPLEERCMRFGVKGDSPLLF